MLSQALGWLPFALTIDPPHCNAAKRSLNNAAVLLWETFWSMQNVLLHGAKILGEKSSL